MKLKHAAITERKMGKTKFKKHQQARKKARAYYAKTHKPKKSMKILFELNQRIKAGYRLLCALRNIFKKHQSRNNAKKSLHKWYKIVGRGRITELISVCDTIKGKEEYVLNYVNNRSTNASAESLNSKMKGVRAQIRGVVDLSFFMYCIKMIFS
jgi:transposase